MSLHFLIRKAVSNIRDTVVSGNGPGELDLYRPGVDDQVSVGRKRVSVDSYTLVDVGDYRVEGAHMMVWVIWDSEVGGQSLLIREITGEVLARSTLALDLRPPLL